MRTILIFVFVLSTLFFSCDKQKKSSENKSQNAAHYILHTSNLQAFYHQQSFEEFLSFFKEVNLPFTFRLSFDLKLPDPLPTKFNSLLHTEDDEQSELIPVVQYQINSNQIATFLLLRNNNKIDSYRFCVFNLKGRLIDVKEAGILENKTGNTYSIVRFDKCNGLSISDVSLIEETNFVYRGNGTAEVTHHFTDRFYVFERMSYKVMPDGTISNRNKIVDITDRFLKLLGVRKFEEAFELQNNKNWGSLSNFSSKNAFGGITYVEVDSLYEIYESNNKAIVYCSAFFRDTVNGSSHIEQEFTLNKKNGKWLITNSKVLKNKKAEVYSCPKFEYSKLTIKDKTDVGFEFSLFVVSKQTNPYSDQNYAGRVEGKAQFDSEYHAIFNNGIAEIDFFFLYKKNTIQIKEKNCNSFRSSNLTFDGIYEFSIENY